MKKIIYATMLILIMMTVTQAGTTEKPPCCNEPLYNHTMSQIPKDTDWYFLVVFGDNRPENPEQTELPSTFYLILNETRALNPHAIIGTGDHVGTGSEAQYIELWKALNSFQNVLLVPGNHDLLTSRSDQKWIKYVGPRYWCWEEIPNWSVVGVDTYDKSPSRFQKEVNYTFSKCKNHNIILVTHYPIEPNVGYNINTAPNGYIKKRILLNLIEKYNIKLVLQGHWHGYAQKKTEKTLFVITGGAGAPPYNLRTTRPDADYYRTYLEHYIVIILNSNGEYELLPIYLNKGKIIIEKPNSWEAHIYQDKYLLNGSPANLPVRLSLSRNNISAEIQLIVPHGSWVNITLLENGKININNKAYNIRIFSTQFSENITNSSINKSNSNTNQIKFVNTETYILIFILFILVLLKFVALKKDGPLS